MCPYSYVSFSGHPEYNSSCDNIDDGTDSHSNDLTDAYFSDCSSDYNTRRFGKRNHNSTTGKCHSKCHYSTDRNQHQYTRDNRCDYCPCYLILTPAEYRKSLSHFLPDGCKHSHR
jgi:hypothetical protein